MIPLVRPKYLIGRDSDCQLRPSSELVSGHHCVISTESGCASIRDLGSDNGTYVNDERIVGKRELQHGDILTVGPLEFEIDIPSDAETSRLVEVLGSPRLGSGIRCRVVDQPSVAVIELCREIRAALNANHLIFCPCGRESRLEAELAVENSEASSIVAEGFHGVVILDVIEACDAAGVFDIETFWKNAFISLSRELGLSVPSAHHNDRSCIEFLLDLPKSLLCFLRVERVPRGDLASLRSMTQEKHPALILYRSSESNHSPLDTADGSTDADIVPNVRLETGMGDSDVQLVGADSGVRLGDSDDSDVRLLTDDVSSSDVDVLSPDIELERLMSDSDADVRLSE